MEWKTLRTLACYLILTEVVAAPSPLRSPQFGPANLEIDTSVYESLVKSLENLNEAVQVLPVHSNCQIEDLYGDLNEMTQLPHKSERDLKEMLDILARDSQLSRREIKARLIECSQTKKCDQLEDLFSKEFNREYPEVLQSPRFAGIDVNTVRPSFWSGGEASWKFAQDKHLVVTTHFPLADELDLAGFEKQFSWNIWIAFSRSYTSVMADKFHDQDLHAVICMREPYLERIETFRKESTFYREELAVLREKKPTQLTVHLIFSPEVIDKTEGTERSSDELFDQMKNLIEDQLDSTSTQTVFIKEFDSRCGRE